tara:strand:- start:28 stop:849 length:822 start_codon:yes stop_codon:yes gene_type:complete
MLMANGAQAVTYRDAADTPIFEPPLGKVLLWKQTLVTGLFDASLDMKPVVANLEKAKVLSKPLQYKLDGLEDKDWELEWMDNFHPIQFGDRLWICPTWRDIPDPNAVNILLDPGMAFGTGTHPTTAMCLEWLDANVKGGEQVVDFGCGSGILGIAALKLGSAKAMGIDIDKQALLSTQENAERNQVADQFDVFLPEQHPNAQADLVLANVLAGPLRELSDIIKGFVKPGGRLVLSGILERQAQSVMDAYAPEIEFETPTQQEEWVMLAGYRAE